MDRQWIIDGAPIEVDDGQELAEAIGEAASILNRVGGAIVMVAQRQEVAPDMWETVSFLFKWSSYVPAKRMESVPEPEPDLAAAA